MDPAAPRKVFISYSHDSDAHRSRVRLLAKLLRDGGVPVTLDLDDPHQRNWPQWMKQRIAEADAVLVVCTPTYRRRWDGEENPGVGKGVTWEGLICTNLIYKRTEKPFAPILFTKEDEAHIPDELSGGTHYRVDTDGGKEALYRWLTHQPLDPPPPLGPLRPMPPHDADLTGFENLSGLVPPRTFLNKLPTGGQFLIGRDGELQALSDAWNDPKRHLFTLIAWGGVGKTALTNRWLDELREAGWCGARRVYAWSFYSQGAKEGGQASADEFFDHALRWFGDPDPTLGSAWDKGARLAGLIRGARTLLILDGLEPLQYPPGVQEGRLKDPGLQTLLLELARGGLEGLCLVSSRLPLTDLEPHLDRSVQEWRLDHLTREAGAELLRRLKVKGTDAERREAAHEFRGHALALNLLGRYLVAVHDGEVRKRDCIPMLEEEERHGGHARRVLESYERWLEGADPGHEKAADGIRTPEVAILYLMGLFDRPVDAETLNVMRNPPVIEGLTEPLQELSPARWAYALSHLRGLGLLAKEEPELADRRAVLGPAPDGGTNPGLGANGKPAAERSSAIRRSERIDSHPLVREHFGGKLEKGLPAAWLAAHARLYEHFRQLPAQERPDTLEELEPLFRAVHHSCRAGLHQRALVEVYWPRILRENEHYTIKKLGAFGADLAAVAEFFDPPWQRPAAGLSDDNKAAALNWAGFRLRALGRLREAVEPMEAGLEIRAREKNWKPAAINAGNLSELHLTLGDCPQAVTQGRAAVAHADRGDDWGQQMIARTTLADALHQAGEPAEAERLFREAEAMQQERLPQFPYLTSFRGYRFCDLLLDRAEGLEAERRAAQTIEIAKQNHWLLDIALDTLTLGRARRDLDLIRQAVAHLREAGYQYLVPPSLLALAAALREAGEAGQAATALAEAREIAERGEMGLWLVDCDLEQARQSLANGDLDQARTALAAAQAGIDRTGYHRRDPEAADIARRLADRG